MLYKYRRTPHLPWSPGATSDDKMLLNVNHLLNKHVVITEKLDGENTTIDPLKIYARSVDSNDHLSRHWIKNQYSHIAKYFPRGYRVCGENVYAKHSIHYSNLESYFYAFSVWEYDTCLNWENTKKFLAEFDIPHVPVMFEGIFTLDVFKLPQFAVVNGVYNQTTEKGDVEGYVVRVSSSFDYHEFDKHMAKFVRKDHVNTDNHWMFNEIVKNKLKNN